MIFFGISILLRLKVKAWKPIDKVLYEKNLDIDEMYVIEFVVLKQ